MTIKLNKPAEPTISMNKRSDTMNISPNTRVHNETSTKPPMSPIPKSMNIATTVSSGANSMVKQVNTSSIDRSSPIANATVLKNFVSKTPVTNDTSNKSTLPIQLNSRGSSLTVSRITVPTAASSTNSLPKPADSRPSLSVMSVNSNHGISIIPKSNTDNHAQRQNVIGRSSTTIRSIPSTQPSTSSISVHKINAMASSSMPVIPSSLRTTANNKTVAKVLNSTPTPGNKMIQSYN